MPLKPTLPPWPDNDIVRAGRETVKTLQDAGHEAFFVGGCVRDWLIGGEPHDVDVATSAHPEVVQKLFSNTREVGARFGVVLVAYPHAVIEVATFRSEGAYADFRRPSEVRYGTQEEDAKRRDFTINALYYDPISSKLVDYFAGTLDLRRRILKTVGAARHRFEEDALRLIRAVRLTVRYNLDIEENTRKALLAKGQNLKEISIERVAEELLRILTGPHPGRAMHLMHELALWQYVIPEVEALKGCEQGATYHPEGDVFTHTALVLENLPSDPAPELALAALLHDIGKPKTFSRDGDRIHFLAHQRVGAKMAEEICRRLRYSNELTVRVADLVEHHMMFMDAPKMRRSTLRRFVGRPDFQIDLDLHRADSLGSNGDLDAYHFCVEQRRSLSVEHGHTQLPPPLLSGNDLIAMGLKPGPDFKALLDAAMDEQLEGSVKTHEEALAFIRRRLAGEPQG